MMAAQQEQRDSRESSGGLSAQAVNSSIAGFCGLPRLLQSKNTTNRVLGHLVYFSIFNCGKDFYHPTLLTINLPEQADKGALIKTVNKKTLSSSEAEGFFIEHYFITILNPAYCFFVLHQQDAMMDQFQHW